eukprot:574713-Pelagomonas_calceolata.AAC.1
MGKEDYCWSVNKVRRSGQCLLVTCRQASTYGPAGKQMRMNFSGPACCMSWLSVLAVSQAGVQCCMPGCDGACLAMPGCNVWVQCCMPGCDGACFAMP